MVQKRCVPCDRTTEHVAYDEARLMCARCASVTHRHITPTERGPRGSDGARPGTR